MGKTNDVLTVRQRSYGRAACDIAAVVLEVDRGREIWSAVAPLTLEMRRCMSVYRSALQANRYSSSAPQHRQMMSYRRGEQFRAIFEGTVTKPSLLSTYASSWSISYKVVGEDLLWDQSISR